jgi:hypothetical protein
MAALEVHISLIQRKRTNAWGIPLAYERFVAVWAADGTMLGVGGVPLEFDDGDSLTVQGREAGFRYVVSMSWAWRSRRDLALDLGRDGRDEEWAEEDGEENAVLSKLGTGFLDDEVVLGVGVDDLAQVAVRANVQELLGCVVLCVDQDREDEGDG